MEVHEILLFPVRVETLFFHPIKDELNVCRQVRLPVDHEMPSFIPFQLLGDPLTARSRSQDAHHHRVLLAPFKSGERVIMKQVVERLVDFEIDIEIDAAKLFQGFQPGHVADERIFLGVVGFLGIRIRRDVEIVFIP